MIRLRFKYNQIIRNYSSSISFPPIPSANEFKELVKSNSSNKKIYRDYLYGPKCIDFFDREFSNKIDIKDRTIIELFPGTGLLTRSILKQHPKGIIPIEPKLNLQAEYQKLQESTGIPIEYENLKYYEDCAMEHMLTDYDSISNRKLDRPTYSFDQIHPELCLVGTVTDEWKSLQLIKYLTEACYNRQGWFKYGRIPVYLLLNMKSIQKLAAGRNLPWMISSIFDMKLGGFDGPNYDAESKNLIDPLLVPSDSWLLSKNKRKVAIISLVPLSKSRVEVPLHILNHIVFILKIKKKSKLSAMVKSIDPGSEGLLEFIPEIDPNTPCGELNFDQLNLICKAYLKWYQIQHGQDPKVPLYSI